MSISKKSHELIRQNENTVKKSQKHDANLQKNSVLYFQIGLIVCLMAAYGLLEMQFETNRLKEPVYFVDVFELAEAPVERFKVFETPLVNPTSHEEKKVVLSMAPTIVDDDQKILVTATIITAEQNTGNKVPNTPDFSGLVTEPVDVFVAFEKVEVVPIYPGCSHKKTNSDRKKCMSSKLTKLIQRKFNTGIASDLGLSGILKIQTQFTIDKTGRIINVQTRSPYTQLENEAKRVINAIPDMEPGKQRGEPVGVRYTLPIKFEVYN